ncbi:MAG: COG4315 family predicted lipoprotein [Solirubrobacterales bacterium]
MLTRGAHSRSGLPRLAMVALLAGMLVAVSGFGGFPFSSAEADSPQKRTGKKIVTGGSDYGTMLFDRKDQAIYLFDLEKGKRSKCYGACAAAWPPVLTMGKPRAGGKARQGLLGTIRRRGGATQVTYGGHPLYHYAHEGPGQVFCHDVFEFGGTWLVVRPNGKPGPT